MYFYMFNIMYYLYKYIRRSEWNMRFSCFPILPDSAEAQVIWGGLVRCLLIGYFIGNISAKNIKNPFMNVRVTANQWWELFWDTVYIIFDLHVWHAGSSWHSLGHILGLGS